MRQLVRVCRCSRRSGCHLAWHVHRLRYPDSGDYPVHHGHLDSSLVAAASALILLPAIFITLEKMGIGAVSGGNNMAKKLGLIRTGVHTEDVMDAALDDDVLDAW